MNSLTISSAVDTAIRAHGQETYPHECCGALVGRDGDCTAIVALPNTTDEGPRRRFMVRPSDYQLAERRATELGGDLLGFYHSHPDHPARPSQYDLDHAWPTFAYIIVAVASGVAHDMTVWYLQEDRSRFEEGSLNHGENSHSDPTPAVPDKQDAVDASGATVGELLADLTKKHGGLKAHLYNEQGKLRSFVNIYVNDEDIRYLEKEATAVKPDDTISIIPSVAGGSGSGSGVVSEGIRSETTPDPVRELPELTNEEIKRYSRHLIMPEVGVEAQKKLKAAKVLCIGAGGLGSPAALYLAAAGVGTLGIVDFDTVDFSNLQRQILHGTPDVGRSKLASAKDKLNAINPNVKIETYETALTSQNALELFAPYDIILDGTDNFPTRYLVNDACVLLGKPNAYGSIFRFEGQASVFATKDGPCYRCLYPEPPPPGLVPSCAEGGVLGVLPGLIGIIQATEAIKLITGIGEPLIGRFMIYDALKMKFRELKLRKDPDCPVCGTHPTVTKLIDYEQFCGVVPAAPEPVAVNNATEITAVELKQRMDRGDALKIVDVREPNEYQINRIPGSQLIPLGDIPKRYEELNKHDEIVVHCKMGGRSAKAADFLRSVGFTRVLNLKGGVLDWVDKVDPTQPKY